jgi:hypothetical protein
VSRTGKVAGELGGEEYEFCLRWGELIELQESRDAGPQFIFTRMLAGQWQMQDVREVVRLGLVGGGVAPAAAIKLVRAHVEQRPQDIGGEDGLLVLAVKILAAALHGVPEEPAGKAGEDRSGSTTSQTEGSGSASSSAMLS